MGWADYAKEHTIPKEVCIALMDLIDRIQYAYLKVDGTYGNLHHLVSDKVKYIEKLLSRIWSNEMLCDKLKSYYYYEDRVITPATHTYRVYHADKVDAAIKELKERIQLDNDEMAGFLDLEEECGGGDFRKYIAELKQKLDEKDNDIAYWREEYDKETKLTDSLKAEIESLKASHYAESVDAGMRERKLKRALWLTRALRARDIQRWWLQVTCSPRTEVACRKWNNVERKCREKAEEYK